MTKVELTDNYVRSLPLSDVGQYQVRDVRVPGFFVVVGKRSKTFTVQVDVTDPLSRRTRTKKKAVGRFPETRVSDARKLAEETRVNFRNGGIGRPEKVTLGEAWAKLRMVLEREVDAGNRSARTLDSYEYGMALLSDWWDTPLADLAMNRASVADRHEELTVQRGAAAANSAMKLLRRVYRHALKRHHELPPVNPVDAVDFNPSRRRNTAMAAKELADWWQRLRELSNPIRREFHLFCLLSGSRPGALKEARWEHIDLTRRALHVPNPKGGARRAYDIPLSREMIRCLVRLARAGKKINQEDAREWVFPGDYSKSRVPGKSSGQGHLVEYREDRKVLPKWGGDLRQTYATLSIEAGVSKADRMILMNHADNDVSDGYVTRSKVDADRLRKEQQKISSYISEALNSK